MTKCAGIIKDHNFGILERRLVDGDATSPKSESELVPPSMARIAG